MLDSGGVRISWKKIRRLGRQRDIEDEIFKEKKSDAPSSQTDFSVRLKLIQGSPEARLLTWDLRETGLLWKDSDLCAWASIIG